jgi:hypothetical protein
MPPKPSIDFGQGGFGFLNRLGLDDMKSSGALSSAPMPRFMIDKVIFLRPAFYANGTAIWARMLLFPCLPGRGKRSCLPGVASGEAWSIQLILSKMYLDSTAQ